MAAFKILVTFLTLAVVSSMPTSSYGDNYENRDYKFNYVVRDDYTYNYQTRDEQKYGKTVTGQYTVLEPTGELRVVNYIADDKGFRAEVSHEPYNNAQYNKPAYPQGSR